VDWGSTAPQNGARLILQQVHRELEIGRLKVLNNEKRCGRRLHQGLERNKALQPVQQNPNPRMAARLHSKSEWRADSKLGTQRPSSCSLHAGLLGQMPENIMRVEIGPPMHSR